MKSVVQIILIHLEVSTLRSCGFTYSSFEFLMIRPT
jgi:hypothetical protein